MRFQDISTSPVIGGFDAVAFDFGDIRFDPRTL
jgi:hypothetical protein